MKKLFAVLAAIFLLAVIACSGGGGGGGTNTPTTKWTYMVYMGADNNLSDAGITDKNEMETVGSDSNIKIVLQAEFSNKYTDFSNNYDGQTLRFLVKKDNNPKDMDLSAGTKIGNVDMAAPDTLKDFIVWAKNNYPADHYALVIWDHGGGWKASRLGSIRPKGAVQDETSGHFMSLSQLAQGVRDSGVHFDLINFDACLMAMYEVAYEFKGLSDYMVFSEETEPGDGDPYDTILSTLAKSPTMTSKTLATTIVDKYYDYYNASAREDGTTKSAVDMSKIEDVHTQVVQLANGIVNEYSTVSSVVSGAQENSQKYAYETNHDLYDFASYLNQHLVSGETKTAAAAVMTAVESAVIDNKKTGSKAAGSHGLAIYAPTRNQVSYDGAQDDLLTYSKLACNTARASVLWINAVNTITAAISDVTLQAGGFAFYVEWDTDADVDLYVWEPCGQSVNKDCADTLYAPWMGQTSPNGYFSGDSYNTGVSGEYYVANDYVNPGQYDVIMNYYDDGTTDSANVTLWYIDPAQGYNDWVDLKTIPMDLSYPYTGDFSDLQSINDLNAYSDWWYPTYLTRAVLNGHESISINSGKRTIEFRINRKKVQPGLANLKR